MSLRPVLSLLAVAVWAGSAAASPQPSVVSCPFSGTSFDSLARGFYVEAYPGDALGLVTLRYLSLSTVSCQAILVARSDSFIGPLIGSATETIPAASADANVFDVSYDFGGVPVPFGSTVTFAQSADCMLYFDAGPCSDLSCSSCPGIFETADVPMTATLTPVRASVGVAITTPEPGGGAGAALAVLLGLARRRASRRHRR